MASLVSLHDVGLAGGGGFCPAVLSSPFTSMVLDLAEHALQPREQVLPGDETCPSKWSSAVRETRQPLQRLEERHVRFMHSVLLDAGSAPDPYRPRPVAHIPRIEKGIHQRGLPSSDATPHTPSRAWHKPGHGDLGRFFPDDPSFLF